MNKELFKYTILKQVNDLSSPIHSLWRGACSIIKEDKDDALLINRNLGDYLPRYVYHCQCSEFEMLIEVQVMDINEPPLVQFYDSNGDFLIEDSLLDISNLSYDLPRLLEVERQVIKTHKTGVDLLRTRNHLFHRDYQFEFSVDTFKKLCMRMDLKRKKNYIFSSSFVPGMARKLTAERLQTVQSKSFVKKYKYDYAWVSAQLRNDIFSIPYWKKAPKDIVENLKSLMDLKDYPKGRIVDVVDFIEESGGAFPNIYTESAFLYGIDNY